MDLFTVEWPDESFLNRPEMCEIAYGENNALQCYFSNEVLIGAKNEEAKQIQSHILTGVLCVDRHCLTNEEGEKRKMANIFYAKLFSLQ